MSHMRRRSFRICHWEGPRKSRRNGIEL